MHSAPMSKALCCKYQAPKPKKKRLKKCIVSRKPLANCDPNKPPSATPNITAKNNRHNIELEKPKTEDCHPSNTLLQLKTLFRSQDSAFMGLSASCIRSIIWTKEAKAPTTEPTINISHGSCKNLSFFIISVYTQVFLKVQDNKPNNIFYLL